MNELRRPIREADEIAAIRDIVERHQLPPFIAGFDVTLGVVDEEPAAWIVFTIDEPHPLSLDARKARAEILNNLVHAIHDGFREEVVSRYPYFRFNDPAHIS